MFPSLLIVDDEPSILQSLGGLLSDEGFEVTTAANGYEALKTIEAEAPDLVLLDIWMPGIDGIALCERIVTFRPDVPVVVRLTGTTGATNVAFTCSMSLKISSKAWESPDVLLARKNPLSSVLPLPLLAASFKI